MGRSAGSICRENLFQVRNPSNLSTDCGNPSPAWLRPQLDFYTSSTMNPSAHFYPKRTRSKWRRRREPSRFSSSLRPLVVKSARLPPGGALRGRAAIRPGDADVLPACSVRGDCEQARASRGVQLQLEGSVVPEGRVRGETARGDAVLVGHVEAHQ